MAVDEKRDGFSNTRIIADILFAYMELLFRGPGQPVYFLSFFITRGEHTSVSPEFRILLRVFPAHIDPGKSRPIRSTTRDKHSCNKTAKQSISKNRGMDRIVFSTSTG